MPPTTATSLGDSVAAEVVSQQLITTAYAAALGPRLFFTDGVQGSLSKSYPRFAKVTAAALTDGTDATTTEITDTQVAATIAEIGIGVALTDLARVGSSVSEIAMRIGKHLGRAYANKVDVDSLAEFAGLTDSVSSTGNPMTEDMFFQAFYETENNDCIGIPLATVLHPKQWNNLQSALAGTTENNSVMWGRTDFLGEIKISDLNGYKTTFNGVPIFVSTNVPTANAGADVRGAVFAIGDEGAFYRVVGILDGGLWDGRYETERDASLRASELWVTGAEDIIVVAADRGCSIVSDAP